MVMSAQAGEDRSPGSAAEQDPARQITERAAGSVPGVGVLVLGSVAGIAAIVLLIVGLVRHNLAGLIVLAIVLFPVADLSLRGLTAVIAGEARVVQLFGSYRGTLRNPGLAWVNPFTKRRRVSTRIQNH